MSTSPRGDDPPTTSGDAPTVYSGDAPTTYSGDAPTLHTGDAPTMPSGNGHTTHAHDDETKTNPSSPSRPAAAGATGPLAVGESFGRYTIVRLLGIGGMGAVYQAWDSELDVVVALKVIRPEVLKDPVAEQEIGKRFKRELLLARQVTHKNVVRIHDLGEIRSIKYITMSYVDGTDLSTMLKSQGKLTVPQTLRIMRAVVSGLVAAHSAGVVHRDLKPANIMVDKDGEALIMDFGIARSTSAPGDLSAAPRPWTSDGTLPESLTGASKYTEATTLGAIVGTVEYMAPEQALAQPIDQRADIYTTGLILYDLLSGVRRADQGGNAIERLRARMERPMAPIKAFNPDVPDALAAIITRAIELDPDKRYQTTAELESELARLDDQGVPLPVKRSVSIPMMAGIVSLVAVLAVSVWYYFLRTPVPEKPHDPVSVVIADLENRTGDPAFDRTVEPMLRRAFEGASFITAYDRSGLGRTVGAALPEKLDEVAARDIAVKQGLGVVISGTIEKQGSAYTISLKATQVLPEKLVSDWKAKASGQDQVIPTAVKLAASIRKDLGDRATDNDQFFAALSLSATSIDAVKYYAAAQEAWTNTQLEDARDKLLKAIDADKNFGVGYLALAGVSRNLQNNDDAQKYINEALNHLDGMTEREKYTTKGMYYRITGDYKQCVSEHAELIKRYAADVIGHNQLAVCASLLRDIPRARDEMREVTKLLPRRSLFHNNYSFYSNYLSDFVTGEQEARTAADLAPADVFAQLGLAQSQSAQGQIAKAIETFAGMAKLNADGKPLFSSQLSGSISAAGLGDLAVYEGRYADAVRVLEQGAVADLAAKRSARAAAKYAEQAYANLLRGQKGAAVASSQKALDNSKEVKIRFLAARIFIDAGQQAKAAQLIKDLSAEAQPEPQAYGKILEAMIVMASKDPKPAIKLLTEANDLVGNEKIQGTWIGHFDLGRAYLLTEQYLQADSEFERCVKRKGEALALFLDEVPTLGYYPMVDYYQGRAKEGAKQPSGAAESYRNYLTAREKAGEDALLSDIKKRIR